MVASELDIRRAADLIAAGDVVAFPTETVYGLGADATDPRAVARVFDVKGRPRFDPLIVHVTDTPSARALAAEWPAVADRLAEAFWPGPLTLVVPKREGVPDLVTAGLPHVGLRVPHHPVAQNLLAAARARGVPGIAAPSANRFGHTSPTTAAHVREEFAVSEVPLVLDGGPCRTGVESTVVTLAPLAVGRPPAVLRLGGTPVEALRDAIGDVDVVIRSLPADAETMSQSQASPGMLDRHYAPRTPLTIVPDGQWSGILPHPSIGGLFFIGPPAGWPAAHAGAVECLSPAGDLAEAATRLFAAIRRLDARGLTHLYAERVPELGLGRAINDRLTRASIHG